MPSRQGQPGYNGGSAGDLYLHIRVVPHPLFDVSGHNVLLTLPLAP
ncbi:Curved DNA-binding protein (CbpA), fragment B [Oleispira antarctica RB-8]|uniref:Curved DNA-binding protein (CbpA), B n=1 Tax=Oleispira antarctica RB-8 TaxID=698738 RepID=R4YRR2_OLEAN|nr:Curved DNA-binding protein (CbpA), fragment B [Oleispira antarctica RB-8]